MKKNLFICLAGIFSTLFILLALCFVLYIYKPVNIVFITDKNYVDYLKVAITSMIYNKNKISRYNVNVICVDIDEDTCKSIEALQTKNVKITTISKSLDAISHVGNYDYSYNHRVSRTDLYKFYLPEIFNDYDKILYLDSDTLILKDLSWMYNTTNLKNKYLAAILFYGHKSLFEYRNNFDKKYYFNCGIMILNLRKMREDKIIKKLILAKNSDKIRDLVTQRAFNEVILLNQIYPLSFIYNNKASMKQSDYIEYYKYLKEYDKNLVRDFKTMKQLDKKTIIIHYSGAKKPWNSHNKKNRFFDLWWDYAKMVNPDWIPENEPFGKISND